MRDERIKELKTNEGIKNAFDCWVLTFGIKDATGGKPDWFSLWNSLQFELSNIFRDK